MSNSYKHKATSVFLLNYHFVWCPKRRRKILNGAIRDRLIDLLHIRCKELGMEILALEVMPDHAHLFVSVDPSWSPQRIMHALKGSTSRTLRSEFPNPLMRMPSLWTRSFFVSTAGNVSSTTIEKYIAEQRTRD